MILHTLAAGKRVEIRRKLGCRSFCLLPLLPLARPTYLFYPVARSRPMPRLVASLVLALASSSLVAANSKLCQLAGTPLGDFDLRHLQIPGACLTSRASHELQPFCSRAARVADRSP